MKKINRLISKCLMTGILLGTTVYSSAIMAEGSEISEEKNIKSNFEVNEEIEIFTEINRYKNSEDAIKNTNSIGKYPIGKYILYKIADNGALNISKTKGQPGSWINPKDRQDPDVESGVFFIEDTVNIYATEEDAVNKVNSIGTYEKGKYYNLELKEEAIRLGKTYEDEGAWVNLSEVNNEEVTPEMLYYLKEKVIVYSNKEDAINLNFSSSLLDEGLYYIKEKVDGAILIKRNKDQGDLWIHMDEFTPIVDLKEDAVDLYKLPQDSLMYESEEEALKEKTPIRKYEGGYYYVYKKTNKAVNITNKIGTPGAWIKLPE